MTMVTVMIMMMMLTVLMMTMMMMLTCPRSGSLGSGLHTDSWLPKLQIQHVIVVSAVMIAIICVTIVYGSSSQVINSPAGEEFLSHPLGRGGVCGGNHPKILTHTNFIGSECLLSHLNPSFRLISFFSSSRFSSHFPPSQSTTFCHTSNFFQFQSSSFSASCTHHNSNVLF